MTRVLGNRIAQGNRNDLDDFEQQGFIKTVAGNRVEFDYNGIYQTLVDTVTPDDVVWTCRCLRACPMSNGTRRSRPGAIRPTRPRRFIAKLKSKIAQGLALATRQVSPTSHSQPNPVEADLQVGLQGKIAPL